MRSILEMTVPGEPQPKGSLKAIPAKNADGTLRIAVQNNNPKTREWQDLVSFHATSEMRGRAVSEGPIIISLLFRLTRPRTHFLKGGQLKKGLIDDHVDKPDVDKLVRCILDALTGICYVDDCQVVTVTATKLYSNISPGVGVVVTGVT